MRLIGVEFVGLGLLEKQYVPLDRGLTLLVGRNNAGKSALLTALFALRELPDAVSAPTFTEYADGDVDINLYCDAEASDPIRPVHSENWVHADNWWKEIVTKFSPTVIYRFRALRKAGGNLGFLGADLVASDWGSLKLIRQESNGQIMALTYVPKSNPMEIPTQIQQGRAIVGRNDRIGDTWHSVVSKDAWIRGYELLNTSIQVSPHRTAPSQMGLQTVATLAPDGSNLATFLHTLHSNDRDKFSDIEAFVTDVFPDFKRLNARSRDNQAVITLTSKAKNKEIVLNRCGAGVGQALILAAQVVGAKADTLFLIDEPHSFLHPVAERKLMSFLESHSDKRFVIATHSSVMMNAVAPNAITHIEPPGHGFSDSDQQGSRLPEILYDLGYRNSDILFNDRIIIGEGATERSVLPILLAASGAFSKEEIDKTGFASLDGVPDRARDQQTAVLRFEQFIASVGRLELKRQYLFDGDRTTEDRKLLEGTKSPATNRSVPISFLPRMELENYLLVPDAIAAAINEENELEGKGSQVTPEQVASELDVLYNADDGRLFPHGKGGSATDLFRTIKGSRVLEIIYDRLGGRNYNKKRTGQLIAKHVARRTRPELAEIATILSRTFQSN